MGRSLSLHAFRLGADVIVIHHDTFPCVHNVFVETADEMRSAVHRYFKGEHADIYISAAAISDFKPKRVKGKIPSGKPVNLLLEPLPKLLSEVLEHYHPLIIAFKLDRSPKNAAKKMLKQGIAMVLMNSPENMGSPDGEYVLLTQEEELCLSGKKDEIAMAIWDAVIRGL
jgi:phosphopantothenoylcysteine decarboxylase/phosphopantothenate--cysteine ligase